MNAIVTGGTGFLGSALVDELIKNGDRVTALVRPNSRRVGNLAKLSGVRIVETDLDENITLKEGSYDVFYHLAWEGERDNFDSQYKNIKMTLNCLSAAAKYGCKRFICTGSQAEYGETHQRITEETNTAPTTAYGSAKVAAYYLSKDLARHLGIQLIWVRVFSVYGENDNPNTLYAQLSKALNHSEEYHMTTDGNHIWNYLHKTDAARALRRLADSCADEGIYNLASKISRPLCEYVDIMRKKVNSPAIITYGNQRSRVNLDVSPDKLCNAIGEFEEIIF